MSISALPLRDLFRVRDCLEILDKYGLVDKDLLFEVNKELNERGQL